MTLQDLTERFLNSMKHTAGSRFNAARRLEKRDRNLAAMAALTSAYIIGLTILPYFRHLPKAWDSVFNFFTVVFSIIVLVSSLLQSSRRDSVNAEQHHRSALEINEVRRALTSLTLAITETQLKEAIDKYNGVLQKYSINHDDIDYYKYQIDHPDDYKWMSNWLRFKRHLHIQLSAHIVTLLTTAVTILFFCLATASFVSGPTCVKWPSLCNAQASN